MKINEVFYSLQGEGARAGEPSIFIRLAGCDLTCGFCDTEFESGVEMTDEELLVSVKAQSEKCHWIVWTGGEPMLQLTTQSILFFKAKGYKQAIETNGNHPIPFFDDLNWVTVSPKVAEHVLLRNFANRVVHELRYTRHAGQLTVPAAYVPSTYKYISPISDGYTVNEVNLQHCIRLCKEHPQWRLSVQMHKLWRVL